jgi:hypothetical protein
MAYSQTQLDEQINQTFVALVGSYSDTQFAVRSDKAAVVSSILIIR